MPALRSITGHSAQSSTWWPFSPQHPPTPHPSFTACCTQELGAAALSKRPTSCMLVLPKPLKGGGEEDEEYAESYKEVEKKIKAAQVF